jgi:hypothetical protein
MSNLKLKINVADSAKRTEELEIAKVLSQPEKYSGDPTLSRYQNETDECVWVEVTSQPMGSLLFLQFGKPSLIIKELLSRCNPSAQPTIKIWSLDKSKLLNDYEPSNKSTTTTIYVGNKTIKRWFRNSKIIKVVTPWLMQCSSLTNVRSVLITLTGQENDITTADNAINVMEPYESE